MNPFQTRRFTKQPQGTARVDPRLGLSFALLGSLPSSDLISRKTQPVIGTPAANRSGIYRNLSANTATQSFAAPLPASKYTIVTVVVPVVSLGGTLVRTTTNGFRVEFFNTGGGVWYQVTHNGVANGPLVNANATFDNSTWVAISTYDGTTLKSWLQKLEDKSTRVTGSAAIGYNAPSGMLDVGGANATQGMQSITMAPYAMSEGLVLSLLDNPYQLFIDQPRLPLAAVTGGGGVQTFSYTATGGLVASGTSTVIRGAIKSTTGGLTTGGTASTIRGVARTTSGGVAFSGASTVLRSLVRTASGGLLFSGAASLSFSSAVQSLVVTATGGINFSGAATKIRGIVRTVTGGVIFGGSASVTLTPDPNPTTKRHFKRGRRPRTRP